MSYGKIQAAGSQPCRTRKRKRRDLSGEQSADRQYENALQLQYHLPDEKLYGDNQRAIVGVGVKAQNSFGRYSDEFVYRNRYPTLRTGSAQYRFLIIISCYLIPMCRYSTKFPSKLFITFNHKSCSFRDMGRRFISSMSTTFQIVSFIS